MSDLHVRNFPDDLHHEANVRAAQNKEPLRLLVIRAVRRELGYDIEEPPEAPA